LHLCPLNDQRTNTEDELEEEEKRNMFSGLSSRVGMIIGGAGLAGGAAAVLSRRKKRPLDDDSSLSGSVSRRIVLLESGEDASSVPYIAESSSPTFVSANKVSGRALTTISEGDESIELEGSWRPSSVSPYAV
jgi:hypothetical protein